MSLERKQFLRNIISDLKGKLEPLEKELSEIYRLEEEKVAVKVERCLRLQDKFTLDELIFSATSRCVCGAGRAYPKNIGLRGSWDCSDILLGRAPIGEGGKQHDAPLPFMFYEIKSETQPSANGLTTRPKE